MRIAVIAGVTEDLRHAVLAVDPVARKLAVVSSEPISAGALPKLDTDCYLLHSPLKPDVLGLPGSQCATSGEVAYLSGQKASCRSVIELKERVLSWETILPEGLPDESVGVLGALVTLIERLDGMSEGLRTSLAMIADEGGFPPELITLQAAEILPGENPYFPEDMRVDLPPRMKTKDETALDMLKQLPQPGEVFLRLRQGDFAEQGYEYRAEQEQFAERVRKALADEVNLLIEAGTGVGKSLGYLIPVVRHSLASGEPVLISTNTKILQDQLLTSDYPKLVELLGAPLPPPVVLKGRENYLCLEKLRLNALTSRSDLRDLLSSVGESGSVRTTALALMGFALHTTSSVTGDFEYIAMPEGFVAESAVRLKRRLNSAFRGCLRERCPLLGQCYFYSQRDAAERSPVVIVNHALLFALAHPGTDAAMDPLASFVDSSPYWILDEGHNLEEVLLDALGATVASVELIEFVNGLQRLISNRTLVSRLAFPGDEVPSEHRENYTKLKEMQATAPGAAESVYDSFTALSEIAQQAFDEFRDERARDVLRLDLTEPQKEEVVELRDRLLEEVAILYDRLLDLNDAITHLAEQTGGDTEGFFYLDDNRYQMQLREAGNLFEQLKQACGKLLSEDETWVRWIEAFAAGRRRDVFWQLAACPVVVGDYFTDLLENRKSTVIVSGTLAIGGRFDYVKRILGLNSLPQENLEESILASPFDYPRRSLVLVPSDVPEPDFRDQKAHNRYLEALAEIVNEAVHVFDGATLVLFNSYSDLLAVVGMSEELEKEGFTLLVQERGVSRLQLASEFRKEDKAILFGTRSFWEGFDIRGEDLQCVIISRFPFPNLHDPLTAGKVRYIDRNGGNSFKDYMLPSAIMKFTQGFGRLIRSTEDYGCVLLLDRRALTKNYGTQFLRNLPGPAMKKLPKQRLGEQMRSFLSTVREAR